MNRRSPLRWLSLVGVIWLQSINGPNTDFPVYSSHLKDLLSISQVQLNNLAFASDAGKLFGWLSGVAAVYAPLPVVLAIGATLGLFGYGVQYLFVIRKISSLSYFQVFVLSVVGGNAVCWINTVCYIMCVGNFTSDPRIAVGLGASYSGLSAKIYTVLADAFFHPRDGRKKAEAYLLLNAVAPPLVVAVTAPLARVIDVDDNIVGGCRRNTGMRAFFTVLFVVATATGFWTMISSLLGHHELLSTDHMVGCLLVLLAAPLVVPAAVRNKKYWRSKGERKMQDAMVNEEHVVNVVDGHEKSYNKVEVEVEEEDVGVSMMVRKVEFWLYFFGYMFGPTIGMVYLNNLGQIVESRGVADTAYLVSLASSFCFLGRLIPPLVEFLSHGHTVSGPAFVAALMTPMAGSLFLLLSPTAPALYLGTAIIGACTGAITSVAVTTTQELFGRKHFGVNHNAVVTNIPAGSFLFGYLAAVLYQRGGGG